MTPQEKELETIKLYEDKMLIQLEDQIKLSNDWYYQKLMECKTEDVVLKNHILRELSEYEFKPSEKRMNSLIDLYNYIKRTQVIRFELFEENIRLNNRIKEIESLV